MCIEPVKEFIVSILSAYFFQYDGPSNIDFDISKYESTDALFNNFRIALFALKKTFQPSYG
jgi:hypothetical protein